MKAFKLKDNWLVCYTGIPGKDFTVSEKELFNIYNY